MKYFWLKLIYLLFLGSVSQLIAEENDLIEVIQKQYQSIRSFSGRFIQSSHLADTETGPKIAEGLVSLYNTTGNTTELMIVNPEGKEIFTAIVDFEIVKSKSNFATSRYLQYLSIPKLEIKLNKSYLPEISLNISFT